MNNRRKKARGSAVFLMLLTLLLLVEIVTPTSIPAVPRDSSDVEVLSHEWRPSTVWELIGKTKFVWKVRVVNRSDRPKRVFAYYDLLDADNHPLASNVANKKVEPRQEVDITSDSYINSLRLPQVRSSRVTIKIGFPN